MLDSVSKFNEACKQSPFLNLYPKTQEFIEQKSFLYSFSFSQIKQLISAAVDLQMWDFDIKDLWQDKTDDKKSFKEFFEKYEQIKNSEKEYLFKKEQRQHRGIEFLSIDKNIIGFGRCPVASPKTRCCNLLTLDVVEGCAYGCSYCSIQTFYGSKISLNRDFAQKLAQIKLDKNEVYHIGTGQSSDSLMLGNKDGTLEALIKFARQNPNVILEFKSKSDNINYLSKANLPPNIICTFSLNPQIIIDNEEHFTASLKRRIEAALKLSQSGILVGFHFHPMIWFKGWQEEYEAIANELTQRFKPANVALVSMGTLTFTKPVLKQIRARADKSRILQMPLLDSNGKFSYPLSIKKQMFGMLYKAFEAWHKEVFFYLCMEDESLWKSVFGFEHKSNEVFEESMKKAYMYKIKLANNLS
ncbi:MAG: radical SAM protein [Campylobacteraceae bacterium]|jgi:spore photoproduct lyase|nr:radical SAM protein [Campylobacteraceae bacterium]